ncbi:hypothetical protein DFS34DRAFT_592273 [Phlyctochytrium arcticum]|nr:hypothetical protein DFS34DRAFT_592273 [Phlyctochytrium arcticum]
MSSAEATSTGPRQRRGRQEHAGEGSVQQQSPVKQKSTSSPTTRPYTGSWLYFLHLAAAFVTIALISDGTPRWVAPMYGHFLASSYHSALGVASVLLGGLFGFLWQEAVPKAEPDTLLRWNRPREWPTLLAAIHAIYLTPVSHAMFRFSGKLGPVVGPLLTMLPAYAAIFWIVAATIRMRAGNGRVLATGVALLALIGPVLQGERLCAQVREMFTFVSKLDKSTVRQYLPSPALADKAGDLLIQTQEFVSSVQWWTVTTCGILTLSAGVWMAVAGITSILAICRPLDGMDGTENNDKRLVKSKAAKINSRRYAPALSRAALLLLAGAGFFLDRGLLCKVNNPKVIQTFPIHLGERFLIHAHTESITGYLSVIEDSELHGGALFLRCDHSLIGGGYLEYNLDSVFGAFYFLEFARFIENPKRDVNWDRRALQIGLGIGIAARGLLTYEKNVTLDLVEIDPVVYDYARTYFALPEPQNVHITDGRVFLDNQAALVAASPDDLSLKYDWILHDVFTGGLVPGQLFSIESLESARSILRPGGVLAMNYVGTLHSRATYIVIRTLREVFPHVICYSEDPQLEDPIYNMVFFASEDPIRFGAPTPEELADRGGMFGMFWDQFPKHHINITDVATSQNHGKPAFVTDQENVLQTLKGPQMQSAKRHWEVMRTLYGMDFWAI